MSTGWVLDEKRLPALPVLLRQPGGDLLGGPEAPEGSVEINSQLLDPRWGVAPSGSSGAGQPHRTPAQPYPNRLCAAAHVAASAQRTENLCLWIRLFASSTDRVRVSEEMRGRLLSAPGSVRATASMRTKALRAWAGNLEVGQVAFQGGSREEGGTDAAETPFLLPSPSLRHRERLRITWD